MNANSRFNENEQTIIDRVVALASQGEALSQIDIEGLIDAYGGDLVDGADYITVGIGADRIDDMLNDEELSSFEGIDPGEIDDACRLKYARERFLSECMDPDADVSPGFVSVVVTDRRGQIAHVVLAVTGYSFSGVEQAVYGAFKTIDAFRETASGDGYILTDLFQSIEDTKAWRTDEEILAAWN